MLEELLKKCFDEETAANKSAENIKTAVLSRIEEEKPMKHFTIKPLLIAAAITATAAASVATANAATDGAVMDGIAKTFSFIWNGEEITGTITEYEYGDDGKATKIEVDLPDDLIDSDTVIVLEGEDGEARIIADGDIAYAVPIGDDVDITSFDKAEATAYKYYKF